MPLDTPYLSRVFLSFVRHEDWRSVSLVCTEWHRGVCALVEVFSSSMVSRLLSRIQCTRQTSWFASMLVPSTIVVVDKSVARLRLPIMLKHAPPELYTLRAVYIFTTPGDDVPLQTTMRFVTRTNTSQQASAWVDERVLSCIEPARLLPRPPTSQVFLYSVRPGCLLATPANQWCDACLPGSPGSPGSPGNRPTQSWIDFRFRTQLQTHRVFQIVLQLEPVG